MSRSYDDFVEKMESRDAEQRAYREFRAQDTRSVNDAVHDGVRQGRGIADNLSLLAEAFAITGNAKVAEDLSFIAQRVVNILDEIRSAYSRDLSSQVNESQRMMFQTFAAAVAVSTREHDSAVRISELEARIGEQA